MNIKTRMILLIVISYIISITPFWVQILYHITPVTMEYNIEAIINQIPSDEIDLIRNGLIGTGAGFILTLILLIIVSCSFKKPFGQLAEAINSVDRGNLNIKLKPEGVKDVKDIINSFNLMIKSLKQDRKLLETYHHQMGWQEAAKSLSYEIINPIIPIQLSLNKINQKNIGCRNEIELIEQEITRLKELAINLLCLSRPLELNLLPKEILPIVMKSLSACEIHQKAKFKLEYKKEKTKVLADEEALKKVFINLIKNGIESMERIDNFTVKIRSDEKNIIIEFIDSGCGIDTDVLETIFDVHYSKKREGMGLGLPVSQQIILAHNGRIDVESKIGQGSNFKVILPAID